MRTRGTLVIVALAMASCATAHSAKGLLLRYKYTPGTSEKYAMRAIVTIRVTGCKQAPPEVENITMNGTVTIKRTAVTAAGVATQEIKFNEMELVGHGMKIAYKNGKMSTTTDGKPMPMTKEEQAQTVDMSLKQKVDTRGQVVGGVEGTGASFGMGPFGSDQMAAVFPKSPVSPGQKWSQTMKMTPRAPHGVAITVDMTYRFAGFERYKGADVARITFEGKGNAVAMPKGMPAVMADVNRTLSGYELFDYKMGVARYVEVNSHNLAKPRPAAGKPPYGTMTVTMVGYMEIIPQ